MAYYKLDAVPHFVAKTTTAIEEAKQELEQEYGNFLRFLLTSQPTVTMHFRSVPAQDGQGVGAVEVGYDVPDETADLDQYLRGLSRYLRIKRHPVSDLNRLTQRSTLKRKVQLVAVGDLEKVKKDSDLRLLAPEDPPYVNFNPRVLGQSTVGAVILAPLTHFVSKWMMLHASPGSTYVMPLPQIYTPNTGSARWRNTLATLTQIPGSVSITCKQHVYKNDRDEDVNYALLCLDYYLGTNAEKLATMDVDRSTSILRTVFSKLPVYTLEISFPEKSGLLQQSFMRDTDPEAFEITPTSLEHELTSEYKRRGKWHPAERYADFFVIDEIVNLITPPYTFRDALPGIAHFVPKPFQEPALQIPSVDTSIFLGRLDTGKEVRVSVRDLTRHMFITGASGAGKSNTMMNIVKQLHGQNIPVLIIDPAKRDFEPLMKDIERENQIWDFQNRWLRFNPFMPADNIDLYNHSVILAKTFSMLFPTNAVAYEILLGMVRETYLFKLKQHLKDKGTELTPEDFMKYNGSLLYKKPWLAPTFAEFLDIGLKVLRNSAGDKRPSQWLMDALEHFERRWANLRRSAFSIMLSPKNPTQRITPLFKDTHLLEFGAWFDQSEANGAFALIFSMMYEQRLSDFQLALKQGTEPSVCVALLDEAHRIVPAHTGSGDERLISAAQEAAGLLTQMIAECRALGQGLIIGEQSASKIDPNVLINTSTKIIHTVLYGKDKEFLSASLALSPAEQDYLAYLRRGEALVFTADTYQPLYLRIPEFGKDLEPEPADVSLDLPAETGTVFPSLIDDGDDFEFSDVARRRQLRGHSLSPAQ